MLQRKRPEPFAIQCSSPRHPLAPHKARPRKGVSLPVTPNRKSRGLGIALGLGLLRRRRICGPSFSRERPRPRSPDSASVRALRADPRWRSGTNLSIQCLILHRVLRGLFCQPATSGASEYNSLQRALFSATALLRYSTSMPVPSSEDAKVGKLIISRPSSTLGHQLKLPSSGLASSILQIPLTPPVLQGLMGSTCKVPSCCSAIVQQGNARPLK